MSSPSVEQLQATHHNQNTTTDTAVPSVVGRLLVSDCLSELASQLNVASLRLGIELYLHTPLLAYFDHYFVSQTQTKPKGISSQKIAAARTPGVPSRMYSAADVAQATRHGRGVHRDSADRPVDVRLSGLRIKADKHVENLWNVRLRIFDEPTPHYQYGYTIEGEKVALDYHKRSGETFVPPKSSRETAPEHSVQWGNLYTPGGSFSHTFISTLAARSAEPFVNRQAQLGPISVHTLNQPFQSTAIEN